MMYGFGFGGGWMWFVGIVLLLMLIALATLVIMSAVGNSSARGPQRMAPSGTSSARQIAEERLARGELTADEFRQIVRALEDRT